MEPDAWRPGMRRVFTSPPMGGFEALCLHFWDVLTTLAEVLGC
jgi:hypothetical protein